MDEAGGDEIDYGGEIDGEGQEIFEGDVFVEVFDAQERQSAQQQNADAGAKVGAINGDDEQERDKGDVLGAAIEVNSLEELGDVLLKLQDERADDDENGDDEAERFVGGMGEDKAARNAADEGRNDEQFDVGFDADELFAVAREAG